MKYDPRLKTFVENDYRYEDNLNFKKQIDDKRYEDLERKLNKNINNYALLDQDEAIIFLKTLESDFRTWRDNIYPVTDFLANFAGSIKDAPGVFKVAKHFKPMNMGIIEHIVNELKGKGVVAKEFLGKNGVKYIKLSGTPSVRRYLNGTRYLINNKKIMEIGVGSVAMAGSITEGFRFGVYFSAGYRAVELMIKDEYNLIDFFVNISMDIAKLIASTIIAKFVVGVVTTSSIFTIAASATLVAIGVFAVGLIVAYILYRLDDEYKISETIIKKLKEGYKIKPPTPYHPDQVFNMWGRYSRG
ncbi:hypothetical protein [Photorhabdus heterorhabditis]|uniref:hypothetical protein n=1 Tax=Photorhabdus heterorhabditis TaxID=880156 RepID=UPI0015624599|nr:hypothetical protein [Photorhabdus heterorhabditis]NRN30820.1 hypothetical protein [Photorhabdus heterorhabditis subsp. aluminescens]